MTPKDYFKSDTVLTLKDIQDAQKLIYDWVDKYHAELYEKGKKNVRNENFENLPCIHGTKGTAGDPRVRANLGRQAAVDSVSDGPQCLLKIKTPNTRRSKQRKEKTV